MTIVEFFDSNAVENIVSALLCAPDRVVLIGDNKSKLEQAKARYREIAKKHDLEVEFAHEGIGRTDLANIVAALERVIDKYGECVFDLTGGEDLYLVAIGSVFCSHRDKVQLHRFNIANGRLYDCDADGTTLSVKHESLSVEENIQAYGGRVIFDDEKEGATHRWDFNEDFCTDVANLWQVCKANVARWNLQVNALAGFHTYCEEDHTALSVEIHINEVKAVLEPKRYDVAFSGGLFRELETYGLIKDLHFFTGGFAFTYKNAQIKHCFSSAGLALELFVTLTALQMKDEKGEPLFTDVMTGVTIDWDGQLAVGEQEVENEIDVILMKDLTPFFISCKNGHNFTSDELYKLSTVASRFGGQYARKMLVATQMEEMEERGDAIAVRAEAMGITVVENIDEIEETTLHRIFKTFAKGGKPDVRNK